MKSLVTFLLFVLVGFVSAQNIAINTDGSSPDPSALLELKSDNRGLLMPRMTTDLRDAIVSPAEALLIYNTDTDCLNVYDTASYSWRSYCPDTPPVSSCPAGMVDFVSFAVEDTLRPLETFYLASMICKNLGSRSRLCSPFELYQVCVSGIDPSMSSFDEWTNDFVDGEVILVRESTGCSNSYSKHYSEPTQFRCCCEY